MEDLWPLHRVAAELLGTASAGSARRTLGRMGVRAVGRQPGRGGESLYDPEEVRAALAARPGAGARTDLRRP